MKKDEFLSIKEAVKNNQFTVALHSYGTSSSGYLLNYTLWISNKPHEYIFGQTEYYLCFSSKKWYKVKKNGVVYNWNYLEKYRKYDEEIESVLFGNNELLSELLNY